MCRSGCALKAHSVQPNPEAPAPHLHSEAPKVRLPVVASHNPCVMSVRACPGCLFPWPNATGFHIIRKNREDHAKHYPQSASPGCKPAPVLLTASWHGCEMIVDVPTCRLIRPSGMVNLQAYGSGREPMRFDLLSRFRPERRTPGPSPPGSGIGAKMVIAMDRVPSQPVQDPPNLVRAGSFSLDRLLSHIDPGTAEESEDFVRLIYDQRHIDLSSDRNGKTGR
jgi:hypothetical protein